MIEILFGFMMLILAICFTLLMGSFTFDIVKDSLEDAGFDVKGWIREKCKR